MEFQTIFESDFFKWVAVPVLIFLARIIDVSLGTIRIIYISRGMKLLAPLFGFFEILIWLIAIGQIMQNVTNLVYYLAYAIGFASGNFVGILIEERLAVGKVVLRIITQKDASALIIELRSRGYGVTVADAWGATGAVKLIFTIVGRKELKKIICLLEQFNPKAFFSVEDVRLAREGIFPPNGGSLLKKLKFSRKGK
ncbi:MAG: DUF2179 domain-containing protein [Syntrophales bacterium]|jgi:uncharacterized protein YebE (UPF0316 family)|nr:DUF2179 domain-containing protein [Syntrophales bacterium]MDY0045723.1 DUF2179 domain-containing protein [Syntrophales bacterium]